MARHLTEAPPSYMQALSSLISEAPLTFALWIKPNAGGTSGAIMSLANFNDTLVTEGFFLDMEYGGSGTNAYDVEGDYTSYGWAQGASIAQDGITWSHVVAVYESQSSRRFYINGVVGASDDTSARSSFSIAPINCLTVGAYQNITQFTFSPITADVADVAIWSKALSDEEIALVYGGHPTAVPTSLRGYWPLAGTTSPEPNVSGDFPALTIYGTAAQAPDPPYECPSVIAMTAAYIVRVV